MVVCSELLQKAFPETKKTEKTEKKHYFQIDRGGRAIYLKVMAFSIFQFFQFFSVFSVPPSSRDLLKLCRYRRENEHVSKTRWQRKKMDIQMHHPDLIFYRISRKTKVFG